MLCGAVIFVVAIAGFRVQDHCIRTVAAGEAADRAHKGQLRVFTGSLRRPVRLRAVALALTQPVGTEVDAC